MAERGGGRVVVTDTLDRETVSFCQHHDFVRKGACSRQVMKIATARHAVNPASTIASPAGSLPGGDLPEIHEYLTFMEGRRGFGRS